MSLRFRGGERLQRGRGIGGLLRLVKSVFLPMVKTAGKQIVRAATSNTGKAVMGSVRDQAISAGTNLAIDALRGSDMQESFSNEVSGMRKRVADEIQDSLPKRRKVTSKVGKKKKKLTYANRYSVRNSGDFLDD